MRFSACPGKRDSKAYYKGYRAVACSTMAAIARGAATQSISSYIYGNGVTDGGEAVSGHRAGKSVVEAGDIMLFDFDDCGLDIEDLVERFDGLLVWIGPSKGWTPDKAKFHAVLALDRTLPMNGEEFALWYEAVLQFLGLEGFADPAMKSWTQQMAPHWSPPGAGEWVNEGGLPLNMDLVLAAYVPAGGEGGIGAGEIEGEIGLDTVFTLSRDGEEVTGRALLERLDPGEKVRVHCIAFPEGHDGGRQDTALVRRAADGYGGFYYCAGGRCGKTWALRHDPGFVVEGDGVMEEVDTAAVELPHTVSAALVKLHKVLGEDPVVAVKLDMRKLSALLDAIAFDQSKGKFILLGPDGELHLFLRSALMRAIGMIFRGWIDEALLYSVLKQKAPDPKQADEFAKTHRDVFYAAIVDHLHVHRQYSELELSVDMFAKVAKVTINDGRAVMILPHLRLVEGAVDEVIVADYKSYWPEFDAVLSLIVGARFASSRKKAYLWLHAPSDWGKGVFTSILADHGLCVDTSASEVEAAMTGKPVGRMMSEFKRAIVLVFNELKTIKGELKMLEQSMSFSPKNLPVCKVPLYLKLCTSAESIDSLASENTGVDDQFANRFSLMRPEGNIDIRPLFRASPKAYMKSLRNYIGRELNRKIDGYIAAGEERAADMGDDVVRLFHEKYGIGNTYKRIGASIDDFAEQFRLWVTFEYHNNFSDIGVPLSHPSSVSRAVRDNVRIKGKEIYIVRVDKTIDLWLESEFNQAERGKLTWKKSQLKAHLPEIKVVRFGYDVVKCMFIGTSHLDFGA